MLGFIQTRRVVSAVDASFTRGIAQSHQHTAVTYLIPDCASHRLARSQCVIRRCLHHAFFRWLHCTNPGATHLSSL